MSLKALYNRAVQLADQYNGSEAAYHAFMAAAMAYDREARDFDRGQGLLNRAISALDNSNDNCNILDQLKRGGAQIIEHGAVFIRPNPEEQGIEESDDPENSFEIIHDERLAKIVRALQDKDIYYDDLVIDCGAVRDNQMRRYPYNIVTIPRLNTQIAVADQLGEALFVANPAIPVMNWALFEKPKAGKAGTPFQDVSRVTMHDGWENRLFKALDLEQGHNSHKIEVKGYVMAHRKKYPLTEAMIVEMARLYRAGHPEKKWPSVDSGEIDRDIIEKVTGDPDWQADSWSAISTAGQQGLRGLEKGRTLSVILQPYKSDYRLTEAMIVEMASLYRARHPEKQWPSQNSGEIDRDIIEAVTGDPDWQAESWKAINVAGRNGNRGLEKGRSLPVILKDHGCDYRLTEAMIVEMALLYRARHPEKQWPSINSGEIDRDIIEAVTGDPDWQAENWKAINDAGQRGNRGLEKGRSLAVILNDHFPERRLAKARRANGGPGNNGPQ